MTNLKMEEDNLTTHMVNSFKTALDPPLNQFANVRISLKELNVGNVEQEEENEQGTHSKFFLIFDHLIKYTELQKKIVQIDFGL